MKVEFEILFVADVKDSDDIEGMKNAIADFIEKWGEVKKPIAVTEPKKRKCVDKIRETELRDMFEDFWALYPKKVDKKNAFASFRKINPDAELLAKILEAVEAFKKTEQWSETAFIPYPSTWLNGRRYEDDLSTIENRRPKGALETKPSYDMNDVRERDCGDIPKYQKGVLRNERSNEKFC